MAALFGSLGIDDQEGDSEAIDFGSNDYVKMALESYISDR